MTIIFFFNFSKKKKTWFYKLSFHFFNFNSIPRIPNPIPLSYTLISSISTSIHHIRILIPRIPNFHLDSLRFHHIPAFPPRFSAFQFQNFPTFLFVFIISNDATKNLHN